jgi:8-oxo-dGTP diphosphatase
VSDRFPPEARLHPARPFLAASVGVVRAGRVLLAARAKEPMRGVYTLPGGLVEPGETLAETALRELMEEVGLSAALIGPAGPPIEIIRREPDGRVRHHFVIHPHAALWTEGEPTTGPEAADLRWVTRAEAAELPTTPGLDGVLAHVLALAA